MRSRAAPTPPQAGRVISASEVISTRMAKLDVLDSGEDEGGLGEFTDSTGADGDPLPAWAVDDVHRTLDPQGERRVPEWHTPDALAGE